MPGAQMLSADLSLRRATEFYEDPVTGAVTIHTRQDVEDVLDDTAARRASVDERARYKDVEHVASIPMPVLMELARLGILYDDKAFRAWLNDPSHRKFRTRGGSV